MKDYKLYGALYSLLTIIFSFLLDARGEGGGGVDQHAMADQAKTLEEVRPSSKPSQNQKSTNIKVLGKNPEKNSK